MRQLAQAFLAQDESQLLFYERRIKEMPLRVLRKHGIVRDEGKVVSLACEELTYQQRAEIRRLCEQKMQEFITKRGLEIWDYRLLEGDPAQDHLRMRVLRMMGAAVSRVGLNRQLSCRTPAGLPWVLASKRVMLHFFASLGLIIFRRAPIGE